MRYFLTLAYNGTRYAGWQRQPNATSVQEVLEQALSTILREPVSITGCGRTDAGVHARYFVVHLDTAAGITEPELYGLNSLLPDDIAVFSAIPVAADAHARFDATARSYEYHIHFIKDPFRQETSWFYPQGRLLDLAGMQRVADLLIQYEAFYPFCKSHSGTDHYRCALHQARWVKEGANRLVFHITANRFLRGMVRLIVGACVQAGQGKLRLEDVKEALDRQTTLKRSLSVPAQGLALTDVRYPEGLPAQG
ncbi:MAG: tRNA pseudouridine(38-40) synthase TruA [Bacteroidetes bacterium]|nr:MAG: tRNA pseudouridine(38-40) synthase TruA [Bacteroidota bacterium]